MQAPTKEQALTLLIFVGAASAALIIAGFALRITTGMLGIDLVNMIDWLIPALVGIATGGVGANEYRKRRKHDG